MESKKKYFFRDKNNQYRDKILDVQKEIYEQSAILINEKIADTKTVLDIGNGGVINYDYQHLDALICADLFVNETVKEKYSKEKNIHFIQSNILSLKDIEDNQFDVVIISYVIHHLAGDTLAETKSNFDKAMLEVTRVLKPSGKLLIVEAVVYNWFEKVEIVFYKLMQAFFNFFNFGNIYQYSLKSIMKKFTEQNMEVAHKKIESGKYTWILGIRVPTVLNPTRTYFFEFTKQ